MLPAYSIAVETHSTAN